MPLSAHIPLRGTCGLCGLKGFALVASCSNGNLAHRGANFNASREVPRMPSLPFRVYCGHKKKQKAKRGQPWQYFIWVLKFWQNNQKQEKQKLALSRCLQQPRKSRQIIGLALTIQKNRLSYKVALFCQMVHLPASMTGLHYGKLWENRERKGFQICRYAIISFFNELNRTIRHYLKKYLKENFVKKGMCADYAIHDINKKPHAHIMLTMRKCKKMEDLVKGSARSGMIQN